MDLFTEHFTRHERAALNHDIDRAELLGVHANMRTRRPAVVLRAVSWLRGKLHRAHQAPRQASRPARLAARASARTATSPLQR